MERSRHTQFVIPGLQNVTAVTSSQNRSSISHNNTSSNSNNSNNNYKSSNCSNNADNKYKDEMWKTSNDNTATDHTVNNISNSNIDNNNNNNDKSKQDATPLLENEEGWVTPFLSDFVYMLRAWRFLETDVHSLEKELIATHATPTPFKQNQNANNANVIKNWEVQENPVSAISSQLQANKLELVERSSGNESKNMMKKYANKNIVSNNKNNNSNKDNINSSILTHLRKPAYPILNNIVSTMYYNQRSIGDLENSSILHATNARRMNSSFAAVFLPNGHVACYQNTFHDANSNADKDNTMTESNKNTSCIVTEQQCNVGAAELTKDNKETRNYFVKNHVHNNSNRSVDNTSQFAKENNIERTSANREKEVITGQEEEELSEELLPSKTGLAGNAYLWIISHGIPISKQEQLKVRKNSAYCSIASHLPESKAGNQKTSSEVCGAYNLWNDDKSEKLRLEQQTETESFSPSPCRDCTSFVTPLTLLPSLLTVQQFLGLSEGHTWDDVVLYSSPSSSSSSSSLSLLLQQAIIQEEEAHSPNESATAQHFWNEFNKMYLILMHLAHLCSTRELQQIKRLFISIAYASQELLHKTHSFSSSLLQATHVNCHAINKSAKKLQINDNREHIIDNYGKSIDVRVETYLRVSFTPILISTLRLLWNEYKKPFWAGTLLCCLLLPFLLEQSPILTIILEDLQSKLVMEEYGRCITVVRHVERVMYFVQQFTKQCEARLVRHVLQVRSSQIGQLHSSANAQYNQPHQQLHTSKKEKEEEQQEEEEKKEFRHEQNEEEEICKTLTPLNYNLYQSQSTSNVCGVCGLPLVWTQVEKHNIGVSRTSLQNDKEEEEEDNATISNNNNNGNNDNNPACTEKPWKMDGSLVVRCLRCGHGGHVQHIQEWCNDTTVAGCPRGCNCLCLY